MGLPPSELGADQVSATCRFPAVALTFWGRPGVVAGVTVPLAGAPGAPALWALTSMVCSVPRVRLEIV